MHLWGRGATGWQHCSCLWAPLHWWEYFVRVKYYQCSCLKYWNVFLLQYINGYHTLYFYNKNFIALMRLHIFCSEGLLSVSQVEYWGLMGINTRLWMFVFQLNLESVFFPSHFLLFHQPARKSLVLLHQFKSNMKCKPILYYLCIFTILQHSNLIYYFRILC